jgi:Transposase DDE domain group 1
VLFEAGDLIARPEREAAKVTVTGSDDLTTGIAGAALWGPLLDRLGVVAEADRRELRPIGPGGYTGGECYRAMVELIVAGGDVISDRSLLDGEANQRLRGQHRLPSQWTLWRFGAETDFGRVAKAGAVNRTMLARAWALGAGPSGGLVTIDPDATSVATYGLGKVGSTFSYKGQTGLSPLLGVCGETGDVLAVRARAGNAAPGRAMASFVRECYFAVPAPVRQDLNVWVRTDSAGYQLEVIDTCAELGAVFTITAPQRTNVRAAIEALATDAGTDWQPALGTEGTRGSEIAETTFTIGAHTKTASRARIVRLIVRRQRTRGGDQLSFDDLDGWRFHAIITNLPAWIAPAVEVEHHHRRRGGIPEDAIRQLKEDFALCHAPFSNFCANWLWWHACTLAHNVARWLRVLALPDEFHRCRAKRWRLAFFNVAARVVRHAGTLWLRLPRNHAWADAFIEALTRIRRLPAYA